MTNLKAHDLSHNEGGYGYNPHSAKHDADAAAKVEARIQHIIANIDSYKARWAAAVAKHVTAKGIPASALPKIEAEAGITKNEIELVKSRIA